MRWRFLGIRTPVDRWEDFPASTQAINDPDSFPLEFRIQASIHPEPGIETMIRFRFDTGTNRFFTNSSRYQSSNPLILKVPLPLPLPGEPFVSCTPQVIKVSGPHWSIEIYDLVRPYLEPSLDFDGGIYGIPTDDPRLDGGIYGI